MKDSKTKKRFLLSLIAVIACVVMLIGTTFAWFTDSVSNSGNKIQAGTLKIGLKQWKSSSEADPSWTDISGDNNPVFSYDKWEPGYSDSVLLKVSNEGNLALKFNLSIVPIGPLEENPQGHTLADAIDVYTKFDVSPENMPTSFASLDSSWTKTNLKDLLLDADGAAYGVLLPNTGATEPSTDSYKTCAVVLHMQEEAGNEYQNMSIGAGFDIKLNATQYTYEIDGFGNNLYDLLAQLPVSAPIEVIASNVKACKNKDEIKNAMEAAQSGDTILIDPAGAPGGKYYFGEGLTVPEGVTIVSIGEDDVYLIVPMIKVNGENQNYIENPSNPFVVNKTSAYQYGIEVTSTAYTNLNTVSYERELVQWLEDCSTEKYLKKKGNVSITNQSAEFISLLSYTHNNCSGNTHNVKFGWKIGNENFEYTFLSKSN